ncbi:MAG: BglII/BstYI family type II restriction endonuclease [Sulfurimonas sp.]
MKQGQIYYHYSNEAFFQHHFNVNWLIKLMNNPEIQIIPRITNEIRNYFREKFILDGWSNEMNLSANTDLTISAKKDKIALQVQTGNVSRTAYDLLKLQYLYLEGDITAGILIVPSKQAAKKMGSNLAHYERLQKELQLFKKIITIPIILVSFD